MDISIIIVNWNTKDFLINCIDSIYTTIKNLTFEIFVVDNGSSDGSAEAVKTKFPRIKLILNRSNLGYAKANNQALQEMKGTYAVLLNSDTQLTPRAIEVLVDFMDHNDKVGICGGQLLNADGSKQNSIANIPTLATELLNKSLLRRLFPSKYPGKEHTFKSPVEVDSVIGALMVVRKSAIDKVGLFDEDFFLFLEETDWCLKMKQNGWKVFHHPEAKVYHFQGQTAGRVHVRARIEYWRSRYIFFKKHYSFTISTILKAGLIIKLLVNLIFLCILILVSLFTYKKAREKLNLSFKILMWHLKGLPEGYGLNGKGS